MTNIAIENDPVEIVGFTHNSMVDLSHELCKRLPGRVIYINGDYFAIHL